MFPSELLPNLPSSADSASQKPSETEHHRAPASPRDTGALLQGISDSSGDLIFAKDLHGRMRFANPAALALIGKPLDQVLGKTDDEFLNDKDAARGVMENDRKIMESGVAVDVEERVPLPDGTVRIWLSRKMPDRDGDGNIIGVLGVSRDITDRKHAAELVKRLYEVAAALSQAVSPREVAHVTVHHGILGAGATAGSLALFNEDRTMLETVEWVGYPQEVMQHWLRFPPDAQVPIAEAARRGEPVYTTSPQERLARYPAVASLNASAQTQSSACIPLILGDRTVGALGLSFHRMGEFSNDEKDFMLSLTRQCAQALDRARLFEHQLQMRQRASELAEKLERHSRLFERIASSTPDFIYVFDLTGRFLYANRSLLKVWGVAAEQAIGKSFIELGYPQWHADMHLRELRQVIETRQPIKGEVPFTGGSGISGVYEYIFTPVLGPDGSVEAVSGTTRDITLRRANEHRTVRDAILLANVQDAVIVSDLNGAVTFWNEGAARLFGWTAEEMLGKPYADRFPPDARAAVQAWLANVAQSGIDEAGEWYDHRKDGSRVWIKGSIRRLADSPLMPPCLMGVCHDISDRKHADTEREKLLGSERAARAEAERASRMKDEFLATLSHELRTPLNAILGWATILIGGNISDEDLRDGLDTIQRNAKAQTQIIEDLLDMSRIISGKVRLEVRRTDLGAVLQAAVETVQPAADAKGVRLTVSIEKDAGPVSGDSGRLQQVFWNLLTNAVKFTPKFGGVDVSLKRVESHVEITVVDTGEGIRTEFLPHVFDRFQQADATTTRRHGGLGLGLALVKQLVELHGGTASVHSAGAGQGSTFTITLPMVAVNPEPETAASGQQRPAETIPSPLREDRQLLTGLKVLVVDDEPDARALVKRLLSDCGASVQIAGSVEQALTVMIATPPDLLVSDIGMPGEDGYTLIRRIRAIPVDCGGKIPAVALSAYARTEDRVRAIRAGFQSYVVKPVDPTELITVVSSLAGRVSQQS